MTVESGHFRVLATDVQLCNGGYLVEAWRENPRLKRLIAKFNGWLIFQASGATRRCIAGQPRGPENRVGACGRAGIPGRQHRLLMSLPML